MKKLILIILIMFLYIYQPILADSIKLKNSKEVTYKECLNFLLTSNNFDLIIEKEAFGEEIIYKIIINYINLDIRIQTDKCYTFKTAVFAIILEIDKLNLI